MKAKQVFYIYTRRVKPYLTEPEKKPVTYIGLTLFSLSFFGAFAIRPALITITNLQHQIELTREIDEDLKTKLRNISRAKPIYERVEKDIPLIEEALPEEKPLSNLLNSLNYHASTAGVTISSAKLSGKNVEFVGGRELVVTPLSLQISGNFSAIVSFTENLENSRRQFLIESLQIKSSSRRSAEGEMLSGTLNLKTFSLEKEEEGDQEIEELRD